jgi:short-chain Z-isoprenyl diphosphate synthase
MVHRAWTGNRTPVVRNLIYRLYERRLAASLPSDVLPRHVGVILDGNRRYAREHGLSTIADGHRVGADKIQHLLDWCHEFGIEHVTLWLLSTDNFSRDADEFAELATIIGETVRTLAFLERKLARGFRIKPVGSVVALHVRLRHAL